MSSSGYLQRLFCLRCMNFSRSYLMKLLYYVYVNEVYELVSIKTSKLVCASIKNSDQPAHHHSLIRVYDGRSFGGQEFRVYSCEPLRL